MSTKVPPEDVREEAQAKLDNAPPIVFIPSMKTYRSCRYKAGVKVNAAIIVTNPEAYLKLVGALEKERLVPKGLV